MPAYTVYTVGHGILDWEPFKRSLLACHIELLVDTRSLPYVLDAPWFNRDKIEPLARKVGIEYLWLGAQLGPLTQDGRMDPIAKESEPRYREGIKQLMDLAQERVVCLLGSQLDPMVSHRHHLIAQTLLHHDISVLHINEDGSVMPALADLFHGVR